MLEHHINTGNSPPISVPIIPFRKCGRPPKVPQTPGSSSEPEGEDVTNGNIYYLFIAMTARDSATRQSTYRVCPWWKTGS
ncbi:hypothetical protein TNCV_2005031 [Trichonephila clavipes]|nr:hypothetical protein TNCV_2005031 [Trichonephila clavipes]